MQLTSPEISYLPGTELPHARVADPEPAAERQQRSGLLAADPNRPPDVARGLDVGHAEAHGAAATDVGGAAADDRLEALGEQARRVAGHLPVLLHHVHKAPG